MATLEEELRKQAQWKVLKPDETAKVSGALVHLEFGERDQLYDRLKKRQERLLAFSMSQVPYYREVLSGKTPKDWVEEENWLEIPISTKALFLERENDLIARALPKGHQVLGFVKSSGTTGKPTRVLQTRHNPQTFALLKQREYRWFGWDPQATLGVIRLPSQMPKISGKPVGEGVTLRGQGWPNVSGLFKTGPFMGFGVTNPIEEQVRWLGHTDPHYLLSYAESLEHLSFAMSENYPGNQLKGVQSISETMTPDMKEKIGRCFNVPLDLNYGLNELGLVASRCPEGGRYHVHNEYFHVEILRNDGKPCKPGERGRVVVTALSGFAMPLIRYDTDDLAVATDQSCSCGRTLPCFGEVLGRYSRIAHLPEGTLSKVGLLRDALSNGPDSILNPLRRFQIIQTEEENFLLKVQGVETFSEAFLDYVRKMWESQGENTGLLDIEQVAELKAGPNGKYQDFISSFQPNID